MAIDRHGLGLIQLARNFCPKCCNSRGVSCWMLGPFTNEARPLEVSHGFSPAGQLVHAFFVDCPPNRCQQIVCLGFRRNFACAVHRPNHLSSDLGAGEGISIVVQQLVLPRTPFFLQSGCDSRLNF